MKKISRYLAALLIITVSPVFAAEVTNVEFSYQDGSTVAKIEINGTVRFTHQTEVPKNGRPDRIIVDVLAATHKLGAKEFLDLPNCPVSGIRTSQFSVTPEKIVRLVFDLKGSPIYRIESDTKSIRVIFSSKGVTPFATWSTNSVSNRAAKPVNVKNLTTKSAAKKSALANVTQTTNEKAVKQNKKINQDRLASLSTEKAEVASKTSAKKSTVAKKSFAVKSTESKKVSRESKTKNKAPVKSKVSVKKAIAGMAGPVEPSMSNDHKNKNSNWPKSDVKTVVVSAKKVPVSSTTKIDSKPVVSKKSTTVQHASKSNNVPSKKVSITKPVAKTVVANKKNAKKTPSKVVAVKPAKKFSKKSAAKTVASVNKKVTKKKTTKSKTVASKPTMKSNSKTSRFRRNAASQKLKRTMVAQFPKRLVIKYKSRGRRDPFGSLLDETRTYNSPVQQRVPNVEGTKLVGIIESDSEANRALLEDKEGYGYILKSGDKVRNGYVLRVERDRVYFQIFEYGWSRTIALSIIER